MAPIPLAGMVGAGASTASCDANLWRIVDESLPIFRRDPPSRRPGKSASRSSCRHPRARESRPAYLCGSPNASYSTVRRSRATRSCWSSSHDASPAGPSPRISRAFGVNPWGSTSAAKLATCATSSCLASPSSSHAVATQSPGNESGRSRITAVEFNRQQRTPTHAVARQARSTQTRPQKSRPVLQRRQRRRLPLR